MDLRNLVPITNSPRSLEPGPERSQSRDNLVGQWAFDLALLATRQMARAALIESASVTQFAMRLDRLRMPPLEPKTRS